MQRLLLAGLLASALAGCQTDSFCATHRATDLTPDRQAWSAMTPAQRQDSAQALNSAAMRCRWEP